MTHFSTRDNLVHRAIRTKVCPMCKAAIVPDDGERGAAFTCSRPAPWYKVLLHGLLYGPQSVRVGCGFVIGNSEVEADRKSVEALRHEG